MMDKTLNILLVGVGGQGTLLASNVLSRTAMIAGLDVKKSEVHGMAQRGGSVVSEIRIGKKVYSPLIPPGETQFLVSFEMMESLRYADTLAADGMALINRQTIIPVTVSSGQQPGLEDIEGRIARFLPHHKLISALDMARELGNIRVTNMIMAGALSELLPLDAGAWEKAINELVPPKHREVNLRAFALGRAAIGEK